MGKFYKIESDGNWLVGNKIYLPSGIVLSSTNKISEDGWFWSETEPQEYLDWLETLI
jgi:hypothetical protein